MSDVDDMVQNVFKGRIDVNHVHARCRNHDVSYFEIGNLQHAFHHLPAFCLDEFCALRLVQNLNHLIFASQNGLEHVPDRRPQRMENGGVDVVGLMFKHDKLKRVLWWRSP